MYVKINLYSMWCVSIIILVVLDKTLKGSANCDVVNGTELESGGSSRDSVISCNETNVIVIDFKTIQQDLTDFFRQSHENYLDVCHTNCSVEESRKKKKKDWLLNIAGGRKQMADILKLAKGLYKKNMATLLIAYKLKFFTLFPLLVAAMMVIVKASGLAGFFFALFIGSVALKAFHHR